MVQEGTSSSMSSVKSAAIVCCQVDTASNPLAVAAATAAALPVFLLLPFVPFLLLPHFTADFSEMLFFILLRPHMITTQAQY